MIKVPNRYKQLLKFIHVFCLVMSLVGALAFFFYKFSLLGGLGISVSLFSLASWFHFRKNFNRTSRSMDTRMTWLFLGTSVTGIALIFVNESLTGDPFNSGVAAGLAMIAGIAYGLELTLVWFANLKK